MRDRLIVILITVLGLIACLGACSSSAKKGSGTPKTATPNATIDMAKATGVGCKPPIAPGKGHPQVVVARVFNAQDSKSVAYMVGWQVVPYDGPNRTYKLDPTDNLLALQPATGGAPLGYGAGTVTFANSADSGTIDATVALKMGGTVAVTGAWHCVPTGAANTATTKPATS